MFGLTKSDKLKRAITDLHKTLYPNADKNTAPKVELSRSDSGDFSVEVDANEEFIRTYTELLRDTRTILDFNYAIRSKRSSVNNIITGISMPPKKIGGFIAQMQAVARLIPNRGAPGYSELTAIVDAMPRVGNVVVSDKTGRKLVLKLQVERQDGITPSGISFALFVDGITQADWDKIKSVDSAGPALEKIAELKQRHDGLYSLTINLQKDAELAGVRDMAYALSQIEKEKKQKEDAKRQEEAAIVASFEDSGKFLEHVRKIRSSTGIGTREIAEVPVKDHKHGGRVQIAFDAPKAFALFYDRFVRDVAAQNNILVVTMAVDNNDTTGKYRFSLSVNENKWNDLLAALDKAADAVKKNESEINVSHAACKTIVGKLPKVAKSGDMRTDRPVFFGLRLGDEKFRPALIADRISTESGAALAAAIGEGAEFVAKDGAETGTLYVDMPAGKIKDELKRVQTALKAQKGEKKALGG